MCRCGSGAEKQGWREVWGLTVEWWCLCALQEKGEGSVAAVIEDDGGGVDVSRQHCLMLSMHAVEAKHVCQEQ